MPFCDFVNKWNDKNNLQRVTNVAIDQCRLTKIHSSWKSTSDLIVVNDPQKTSALRHSIWTSARIISVKYVWTNKIRKCVLHQDVLPAVQTVRVEVKAPSLKVTLQTCEYSIQTLIMLLCTKNTYCTSDMKIRNTCINIYNYRWAKKILSRLFSFEFILLYLSYILTHTLHYISTFFCAIPNELNTELPNINWENLQHRCCICVFINQPQTLVKI